MLSWKSALLRRLAPGVPARAFALWAALTVAVGYNEFGGIPDYSRDGPARVAYTVLLVLVLAEVFQLSLLASTGFAARCALCMGAACASLEVTHAELWGWTSWLSSAPSPVAGLSLVAVFVVVVQDELRRQSPAEGWRSRQRAFNRRMAIASAIPAAFLAVLGLWGVSCCGRILWAGAPLVIVSAAAAFVLVPHMIVASRLRTALVWKLALTLVALMAVLDAFFDSVARAYYAALPWDPSGEAPGDVVQVMHWLGEELASLRVGIMSFVGVAWSAFCTVMHFEYRETPPAGPFARPGPAEEGAGEEGA